MNEFLRFAFGQSRRMLFAVVAIGAASGLLGAALIAVVGQMFARMAELEPGEILTGALLMVLLAVFVLGLELLAKRLLVRHSARCAAALRRGLAATVLKDPLGKTEALGSARLMAAYSEDVRTITMALNQIPVFGIAAFVIVGCMAYLVWLSPGVFLVLLALAVPSVAVSVLVQRRSKALSREVLALRNTQVNAFRGILSGLKELQLNRASCRRYLDGVFGSSVAEHERVYVRSMLMFSLNTAWTQLVYFLSITAVLIYMVASGQGAEIIAPYIVVALYMKGYIAQLLGIMPAWSQAGVLVEQLRAQGHLSFDAELPARSAAAFLESGAPPVLEARGLVYAYRDEQRGEAFSVGPLDIDFHAGELVFIVGHNGAGKSTLVKLLAGLYECRTGTLRYAGVEVDAANRESYRQLFSVIFTVPFVFDELPLGEAADGTLAERERRIHAYLERLGLQYKVRVEGNRLTTVDLSHGQRKRLALLAAYLEDRPVVVFDEWAENQDPAFKEVFYKELLPELRARGKLVIVVSHEAQYFHVADRIVTLNAPEAASSIASDVLVEVPPPRASRSRSGTES